MKKIALITLILACILVGCGLTGKPSSSSGSSSATSDSGSSSSASVGMPTPFTNYPNLEEAHEAMEIDFKAPGTMPEGFMPDSFSVWNDKSIAQIIYMNGEDQITYRVSPTLAPSEITGDHTEYPSQKDITVEDTQVSCKGNDEDAVLVATWQEDGLTYSISSNIPLTTSQLETIIKSI